MLNAYRRDRDLPRLLPLTPAHVQAGLLRDDRRVVALIKQALMRERRRGVEGHWSYDVARHRLLLIALRCELDRMLQDVRGAAPDRRPAAHQSSR